jgi:predicted small secreted protein
MRAAFNRHSRPAFGEFVMLKKIQVPVIAALAALGAFSVSACNTVRGVGQDVEATGEAVSEAATETQQEIKEHN